MYSPHKGTCEHCGHSYRYSLLSAVFGDYSYAYCDRCGALATVGYTNPLFLQFPPTERRDQVIDEAWEPFLKPCRCGGSFRASAVPRCPICSKPLSAEAAASHIEQNFRGGGRGWRWQRNWNDAYCIDIEDAAYPAISRLMADPFLTAEAADDSEEPRKGWLSFFKRHA